jgi:hypothetical protein
MFRGNEPTERFDAPTCARRAKMTQSKRSGPKLIHRNSLVINGLSFYLSAGMRAAGSVSAILWLRF